VKIQRTLAPTAAPLSWGDLLRGLGAPFRGQQAIEKLTKEFQNYFKVKHLFWVTSGKAALTVILLGLSRLSSRRKVLIPAYTCFSVPSSIIKAGLDVALCDVDAKTLDFDMASLRGALDQDVLAVVPTHLFGSCADVTQAARYAKARQIYVVEDVAQAFGGMRAGRPLGTTGDVGFLSFGRGKNLTCGSGGLILTNSDQLADAIRGEYERLGDESFVGAFRNWLEVALIHLLIRPSAYWFPDGLPFLKLGETRFYRDFPILKMDRIRAGLLANWRARLSGTTLSRSEVTSRIARSLNESGALHIMPRSEYGSVHLRLPVLMKTSEQKRQLCALSKQRGLGISPCYPAPVRDIPELQSTLRGSRAAGASMLAECLVALPTHRYVTDQDVRRIVAAVKEVQTEAHDTTQASTPTMTAKVTSPC
jgi:dTDP-4-amino-4,6-dideoxygalactose transaminase